MKRERNASVTDGMHNLSRYPQQPQHHDRPSAASPEPSPSSRFGGSRGMADETESVDRSLTSGSFDGEANSRFRNQNSSPCSDVQEFRLEQADTEDTTDDNSESTMPQHENLLESDEDFELSLICQRNRRVLLSRLQETLPQGKLSLVRV
jgi:hypothetical protein